MASGALVAWIDVGTPSAERRARFTARRRSRSAHSTSRSSSGFEAKIDRRTQLEITRSDGQLYVVVDDETIEAPIARVALADDDGSPDRAS